MVTRAISFVEGEFYHIYNRGTDKRLIFQSATDYDRFSELLYAANERQSISLKEIKRKFNSVYEFERSEQLVAIGAYCLMPNHFHLLVTPLVEDGISKFMGKLTTGYSMYFNKKYDRSGVLFEGRFKAKWANSDEYLKYLFSYIHLNPVKLYQSDWKEQGIKDSEAAYDYASRFKYSSLANYQGSTQLENNILNKEPFPDYLEAGVVNKVELLQWLEYEQ